MAQQWTPGFKSLLVSACILATLAYISEAHDCPQSVAKIQCIRGKLMKVTTHFIPKNSKCIPRESVKSMGRKCLKMKGNSRIQRRCVGRYLYLYIWFLPSKECQCWALEVRSRIGLCQCPKIHYYRTGCNLALVTYKLINNRCYAQRKFIPKYCPAYPPCRRRPWRRVQCVRKGRTYYQRKTWHYRCRFVMKETPIQCNYYRIRKLSNCGYYKKRCGVRYRCIRMQKVALVFYKRKGCRCVIKRITYLTAHCCRVRVTKQRKMVCNAFWGARRRCFLAGYVYRVYIGVRTGRRRPPCQLKKIAQWTIWRCKRKAYHKRRRCRWRRIFKYYISYKNTNRGCMKLTKVKIMGRRCPYGAAFKLRRGGSLLLWKRAVTRRCKCVKIIRRIPCPTRCKQPRIKSRCIVLRNRHIVLVDGTIVYLFGCSCVRRPMRMRYTIKCPRSKVLLKFKCEGGRIVNHYREQLTQRCLCITRYYKVRTKKTCIVCPKNIIERECKNPTIFVYAVAYVIANGKCVKRKKLIQRNKIACPPSLFKRDCDKKTGKLTVSRAPAKLVNCRCEPAGPWKVVRTGRCNCNGIKPRKTIKRCVRNSIQETTTFRVVLIKEKCVQLSAVTTVSTVCPDTTIVKGPCNERVRQLIITRYKVRNCKCIVEKGMKSVPCPCKTIRFKRRLCVLDAFYRSYIDVTRTIRQDDVGGRYCRRRESLIRRRVVCASSYKYSPCKNNVRMLLIIRRQIRPRKNKPCACVIVGRTKRKMDCVCNPLITKGPCTLGYRLIVARIRNQVKGNCVFSKDAPLVIAAKPCKCVPQKPMRDCNGKRIRTIRRSIDSNKRVCDLIVTLKFPVCPPLRSVGQCVKCKHEVTDISFKLDRKSCTCKRDKVKKRQCDCCCPKAVVSRTCVRNIFHVRTVFYTQKPCGQCRRRTKIELKVVNCPRVEILRWSKCVKCRSRLTIVSARLDKCKCRRVSKQLSVTRRCCCPRRKYKKSCFHGFIMTWRVRWYLRNYRCIRVQWWVIRQRRCHQSSSVVTVGRCNRMTCKQRVFGHYWIPYGLDCRCKRKKFLIRYQDCCCRKLFKSKRNCINGVWFTTTWTYILNVRMGICELKKTIKGESRSCPRRKRMPGPCNRKTCYRLVSVMYWIKVNCDCIKYTRTVAERCCCPPPTPWRQRCNPITGVVVDLRTKFQLVGKQCVGVRERRLVTILCPTRSVTVQGVCNPKNCQRKDLKIRSSRQKCRCLDRRKEEIRRCCCPKPTMKIQCLKNTQIVLVARTYVLQGNKCVVKVTQNVATRECPSITRSTACDLKTGSRIVTKLFFASVNCRCVLKSQRKDKKLCACRRFPLIEKKSCNTKTCKRRVRITTFVREKNKCVPKVRNEVWDCCCKDIANTRCDNRSGFMVTSIRKRMLFGGRKCVLSTLSVNVELPACAKLKPEITKTDCGEDGTFTVTTTVHELIRKTCSCRKRIVKTQKLRCKCEPCRVVQRQCTAAGILRRVVECQILVHGKCVKKRIVRERNTVCPKRTRVQMVCPGKSCRGRMRVFDFVRRGCFCSWVERPFSSVYSILCCCPPLPPIVECIKGVRFTVTRLQRVAKSLKRCVSAGKLYRRRPLICPKPDRKVIQKCKFPVCMRRVRVITYTKVRCQCVKKVTVVSNRCCCPPLPNNRQCNKRKNQWETLETTFLLQEGKCLKQTKLQIRPVRCPPTTRIAGMCDRKTRKMVVRTISYKLKNCACERMETKTTMPCLCAQSRFERESCTPTKTMRRIYRIDFILKNTPQGNECVRSRVLVGTEPCRCPKDTKSKRCTEKEQFITTTTWRLVSRAKRVCIQTTVTVEKKVVCNNIMTRRTCIANQRKMDLFVRRVNPVTCLCERKAVISRTFACECEKKKVIVKKSCENGIRYTIRSVWYGNDRLPQCKPRVDMTEVKLVVCSTTERIISSGPCTIIRNYGVYRRIVKCRERRVGCKCKEVTSTSEELCNCLPPRKQVTCESGIEVTKRVDHPRLGQQCARRVRTSSRPIRCNKFEVLPRKRCQNKVQSQMIEVRYQVRFKCGCVDKVIKFSHVCTLSKIVKPNVVCRNGVWIRTTVSSSIQQVSVIIPAAMPRLVRRNVVVRTVTVIRDPKVCPLTRVVTECNKKHKLVRTVTTSTRVKCTCVPKTTTNVVGKCECPPEQRKPLKCIGQFRTVEVRFFRLKGTKCVPEVRRERERCDCPPNRKSRDCLANRIDVKCTTTYRFVGKVCQQKIACTRRLVMCKPDSETLGPCVGGKQQVTLTTWFVKKCKCFSKTTTRVIVCRCDQLNRDEKKCRNNNLSVTQRIRHTLNQGRCVKVVNEVVSRVVCAPPVVKFLPDCNKDKKRPGTRTRETTMSFPVNCKCRTKVIRNAVPCICALIPRYKTIVTTDCVDNTRWVTRTVSYTLWYGLCIRVVTIRTEIVTPDPNPRRRIISDCKGLNNQSPWVQRVAIDVQRIIKCKPAWKLKTIIREVCRCPKQVIQEKDNCVLNRLRTTISFLTLQPDRKGCFRRITQDIRSVLCKAPTERVGACDRLRCLQKVVRVSYRIEKCKCKIVLTNLKDRVCCCLKPSQKGERCSADGRTRITWRLQRQFFRGRCFDILNEKRQEILCDFRPIKVRPILPCKENFFTIIVIGWKTEKCKCKQVIVSQRIRCLRKCPPGTRVDKGRCLPGVETTVDKYLSRGVDGKGNCVWKVFKRVTIICGCPKVTLLKRACIKHEITETTELVLQINHKTKVCERFQQITRTHVGMCTRMPRLMRIITGKCNKLTGWQTDTLVYIVARNCKCVTYKRRHRWPCNCCIVRKTVVRWTCELGRWLVKTKIYYVNQGKECVKRKYVKRKKIVCFGCRIKRRCLHSGIVKVMRWCRMRTRCVCTWQKVRPRPSIHYCRCPRNTYRRYCDRKLQEWVTIDISYRLQRGRCLLRKAINRRSVHCKRMVKAVKGRCNPVTGYYIIKKTMTRRKRCRCVKVILLKKCQCRCPRKTVTRKCRSDGLAHIVVRTAYQLEGCRCVKHRVRQIIPVLCPKDSVSKTPCKRGACDGRLTVTEISYFRSFCYCWKRIKTYELFCFCCPSKREEKKCVKVGSTWFLKITKYIRVLRNGRCVTISEESVIPPPGKFREFKMIKGSFTFDQAKRECEKRGMRVAIIKNQADQNSAKHETRAYNHLGCTKNTAIGCLAFIAYKRITKGGKFGWVGGTSTFKNWLPGEPNNVGGDEGCTQLNWAGKDAKWNDVGCSKKMSVLCERQGTRCPRRDVTEGECNKVTKRKMITIKEYKANKCECDVKVTKRTVICKCASAVRKVVCNRKTCIETVTTIRERLISQVCRRFKTDKQRLCCCLPPKQMKKSCNKATGVVTVTEVGKRLKILSGDRRLCIPYQEVISRTDTICNKPPKVEVQGRTIKITTYKRVGCECQPDVNIKICRERSERKTCRRNAIVTTSWTLRIIGTSCVYTRKEVTKPVLCPKKVISKQICIKIRFGRATILTTTTFTSTNCGPCMPIKTVKITICECDPPVVKKVCSKGSFLVTTTKFVERGTECKRELASVRTEAVKCRTKWRNVKIGKCKITQAKEMKVGCKCIEMTRTIPRKKCTKEVKRVVGPCVNGKQEIRHISQVWRLCKCRPSVEVVVRPCCRSPRLDVIILVDETVAARLPFFYVQVKKALHSLICLIPLHNDFNSLALIRYCSFPRVIFSFAESRKSSRKALKQKVNVMNITPRSSMLNVAFEMAGSEIKNREDSRKGVKAMVFVITDGEANAMKKNGALLAAEKLKAGKVDIGVAAIAAKGKRVKFLKKISSDPKLLYKNFTTRNFAADLAKWLLDRTCSK